MLLLTYPPLVSHVLIVVFLMRRLINVINDKTKHGSCADMAHRVSGEECICYCQTVEYASCRQMIVLIDITVLRFCQKKKHLILVAVLVKRDKMWSTHCLSLTGLYSSAAADIRSNGCHNSTMLDKNTR